MNAQDKKLLRELARHVQEIASLPQQQEKREMWRRHTSLKGVLPPVFVSPEGAWEEILPASSLRCEDAFAREIELELRKRIFRHEHIRDDTPIENKFDFPVSAIPINEGWGLAYRRRETVPRGAWRHEPVIETPADWKKLKMPSLVIDREGAQRKCELLLNASDGALEANVTGIKIFDFHLAHIYADYRGLENLYTDLAEEPEMVRDVFAFLTEGFSGLVRQAVRENLIDRNDDHTYHYTGGLGYTADLPESSAGKTGPENVWGAAEAQEYACVSPKMFAETVFPFEKTLLEPFGLTGYGCCDDLTEKLDTVLTLKNLRRVAACPWANLEKMADRLKKNYILTWKPNPAMLAGESFSDQTVEEKMYQGLKASKCGYPEIILRDTHSVRSDFTRFTRFVACTRRAIERVYGTNAHP